MCPNELPTLIANRYIIQQRLGKGSFGTVYLVKDTKAGAAERLGPTLTIKFNPLILGFLWREFHSTYCQGRSVAHIQKLVCVFADRTMCCLAQNFLAVVMRIVEGPTPSLPETYSRQLNCLIMLEKDSSRRISAANALRSRLIEESLQVRRHLLEPHRQKKVHLQTLRERSEVQKMSPRERMRLRKLQAADEKVRKLKQIVEEKYQENHLRMQEYKSKKFQKVSVDVLVCISILIVSVSSSRKCKVIMIEATCRIKTLLNNSEYWLNLCYFFIVSAIPEDPQAAEAFYSVDEFEPCSEEDSDGEEDSPQTLPVRHVDRSVCRKLGEDVFLEVYDYLKQARQRQESEENIKQTLIQLVERPGDCFEVDQLLYYEELLLAKNVISPSHALWQNINNK
uniref:non-specific serine/threonine protein kinase n=1 Tax=Sinocyclocheilus rhinocerous TaxID=307959 RepID=A0A673KW23_9TELE